MATTSNAEIKKQVEYYLSDANLARDKFFNDKLREAGAEGWLDIQNILNCNKVKQMKLKNGAADIVEAVKGSSLVEVDETGKKVRRIGGKAVPELVASAVNNSAIAAKKREQKAADKEEEKQ